MSKTRCISQRPAGRLWPSQGNGGRLTGSFTGSTSQTARPAEGDREGIPHKLSQCHSGWRTVQHQASPWGHERIHRPHPAQETARRAVPLLALLAARSPPSPVAPGFYMPVSHQSTGRPERAAQPFPSVCRAIRNMAISRHGLSSLPGA